MRHHPTSQTSGDRELLGAKSRFMRLFDLSHYKVAQGDPDVQGWHVKTADGERVGRVDNLIVDIDTMQVRYLDVELDRKTYQLMDERHVLVPLADARLDDHHDDVLLDTMTAAGMTALQRYYPGQPITPEPATEHRDADTERFYGKRGGTGGLELRSDAEVAGTDPAVPRAATRPASGDHPGRIPLADEEYEVTASRTMGSGVVIDNDRAQGEQARNDADRPHRD